MPHNTVAEIENFLAQQRIALVGASHDDKDFSRVVMRALSDRGIEVVPVNRRAAGAIEGRASFRDLASVPGTLDGVLVMVPASESADVVRAAAARGIGRIWFHRGAGRGAMSPEAVRLAVDRGMQVVAGECPLMFLDDHGIHAAHGCLRRLSGAYPAGGARAVPLWNLVTLALIQILVGASAIIAGAMFMVDPSGALLGMQTDWIARSPFGDFFVPGLVLLLVNGLGQMGGFVLTLRRDRRAPLAAVGLGGFLVLWIIAQALWLEPRSLLMPIVALLGLAEIALGLGGPRRVPRPVQQHG